MKVLLEQTWTDAGTDIVPATRRLVRKALDPTPVPDERAEDIELVVSELLANAVLYALPPLTFRLEGDERRIRIEVLDYSVDLALPPVAEAALAETGRGLMITATLSDEWGWEIVDRRKRVWAVFTLAATPS
jgi:anti-sigma regulatory factor (Ser/Thr protein kinase)